MVDGQLVGLSLGVPEADDYLEFIKHRCRPNTWVSYAYDLQVFLEALRARLTARQREVLHLRLEGYSEGEITAQLGLCPSRTHRILETIRARARALWEEEPAPMPASYPEFATTGEAAQELGYSHVQICRFCREGKVQGAKRVGKQWLIPRPVTLSAGAG